MSQPADLEPIDPLAWDFRLGSKLRRKGIPAVIAGQVLECGHRERGAFARTLLDATPEEVEAIRRAASERVLSGEDTSPSVTKIATKAPER